MNAKQAKKKADAEQRRVERAILANRKRYLKYMLNQIRYSAERGEYKCEFACLNNGDVDDGICNTAFDEALEDLRSLNFCIAYKETNRLPREYTVSWKHEAI